jgi:hypothetical protein
VTIVSTASMDILEVPNPSSCFGVVSRMRMVAMTSTGRLQTTNDTRALVINCSQFSIKALRRMIAYLCIGRNQVLDLFSRQDIGHMNGGDYRDRYRR